MVCMAAVKIQCNKLEKKVILLTTCYDVTIYKVFPLKVLLIIILMMRKNPKYAGKGG